VEIASRGDENTGNIGLIDTTLRDDCPPRRAHAVRPSCRNGGSRRSTDSTTGWKNNLAEKNRRLAVGEGALRQEVFVFVLATGKTPESAPWRKAEADLIKDASRDRTARGA